MAHDPKRPHDAKRLRIAVLHRIFVPSGGGAERYAISLVEQLAARHEVHVFAQQIGHSVPGVTYHRIWSPLRRPRWINQLWYATATWWATLRGFDIVHSHENTWHGNVQTVHVLPVWYNFFVGRTGWSRVGRWLQALTSPRMWTYLWLESARFSIPPTANGVTPRRLVVVTSEPLRRIMLQTFPKAAGALRVLTPGVDLPDLSRQDPMDLTREQARRQLGVPFDARCALFVGNDFSRKGLPALLKAMVELPEDCFLVVVGGDARAEAFRQQAETLGVAKRVLFAGVLKDMAVAYLAADVLAHPTLEDTFAMVVLEAMAYRLPVLVSNETYCGIANMLEDGVNAVILAQPRNPVVMAEALRALLFKRAYREALAEHALAFAKGHAWSAKAREQEALYLDLLER